MEVMGDPFEENGEELYEERKYPEQVENKKYSPNSLEQSNINRVLFF